MAPGAAHEPPARSAPSPLLPPTGAGAGALALVLLVAALLRVGSALSKGLVLDEFHSLFHATAPDAHTFFERLLRDNHPPLSFLVLASARRALGDSELALRAPAILFGLLTIVLVWRVARRARSPLAPAAAALLLAASALHLDVSTQARMYALHALCVTGLLDALASHLEAPARGSREPAAWIVFWIVLGLHVHYYFAHYLGLAGVAVLLGVALTPHERAQARSLWPLAVVAALLCAPWYLIGFQRQLAHGLPPGMYDVSPARVLEALVHLLFVNVRIGGPALRVVFIACGGLALVLAALGFVRLWRARVQTRGVALPLLLALAAFGAPAWAGTVAALSPRAGFNWIYLVPSASALVVLVASALGPGRARPARTLGVGLVSAAALLLALLCATSRGTEDYRGAIGAILAEATPDDALIAVEWQPAVFDQALAWSYYAPRLAGARPLPPRLEIQSYTLARPDELARHARVFLLRRSLPEGEPLMRLLRARYAEERVTPFGFGLWVHRFSAPRD